MRTVRCSDRLSCHARPLLCHVCPLPHTPPLQCMPPFTTHTPPCMPPCHTYPPTMHASCHTCPLPCMPPSHACPPSPCITPTTHAPRHICPLPCMPPLYHEHPPCHACPSPSARTPPIDRKNDTRLWNHYLFATTVADGRMNRCTYVIWTSWFSSRQVKSCRQGPVGQCYLNRSQAECWLLCRWCGENKPGGQFGAESQSNMFTLIFFTDGSDTDRVSIHPT